MEKINNKCAFTMLEIIVAVIITGVLATIALPNIYANVQKSKGAQAVVVLGTIKADMESCLQFNSDQSPGGASCNNALIVSTYNNNGWYYSIATGGQYNPQNQGLTTGAAGYYGVPNSLSYTLIAADAPGDPAQLGNINTITLTRVTDGTWNCSTGTSSPYAGVC